MSAGPFRVGGVTSYAVRALESGSGLPGTEPGPENADWSDLLKTVLVGFHGLCVCGGPEEGLLWVAGRLFHVRFACETTGSIGEVGQTWLCSCSRESGGLGFPSCGDDFLVCVVLLPVNRGGQWSFLPEGGELAV